MSDASSGAQLRPEWGLLELQTSFEALDGGKCETIFAAWDSEEATSVEARCREFMHTFKDHVGVVFKSVTSALTEAVGSLDVDVVGFGRALRRRPLTRSRP